MYIFQPDLYLLEKQIKKSAQYISGRVLDVGAGSINRYGKHFEFDEYIRMDRAHVGKVDAIGSADDIPFLDESFDSVVCTQVFEHLEHPEKAAQEIYRVLKLGGYLLVTAPQTNELHEEPYDFFRYTKFGIISLFVSTGFTVKYEDQRGGFYSTVAQMNIRYIIDLFSLYKRPIIGRVFSKFIFYPYGMVCIILDKIDKTKANKKHAIGWCYIFKK